MEYNKNNFEKILRIAKKQGYTQANIAEKLGFSREYITRLKTGKSNVSDEHIIELSKIIKIDIQSLLKSDQSDQNILPAVKGMMIRHLTNATAFAGDVISIDGSFDEVEEWIAPRLGITRGGSRSALYSFEVKGDSMLPTISPHDLLLCEAPVNKIAEIEDGAIYVIVYNSGVRCKRLRRLPRNAGVVLYSDNPTYHREEQINEGAFAALRVRHRITDVFGYL